MKTEMRMWGLGAGNAYISSCQDLVLGEAVGTSVAKFTTDDERPPASRHFAAAHADNARVPGPRPGMTVGGGPVPDNFNRAAGPVASQASR